MSPSRASRRCRASRGVADVARVAHVARAAATSFRCDVFAIAFPLRISLLGFHQPVHIGRDDGLQLCRWRYADQMFELGSIRRGKLRFDLRREFCGRQAARQQAVNKCKVDRHG
jgi:hypothetical protein